MAGAVDSLRKAHSRQRKFTQKRDHSESALRIHASEQRWFLVHNRGDKTGEEVSCETDKQHRKASSADEVAWPHGTGQDFVSDGFDIGSVHQ